MTQHVLVTVASVHVQNLKSLTTAHAVVSVQTLQHVQLDKLLTITPANVNAHHKDVQQITDLIQQHAAASVESQSVIAIKF